jgi:hypothetical protein
MGNPSEMTIGELEAALAEAGVEDLEVQFSGGSFEARATLSALQGPEGRFQTPYFTGEDLGGALGELLSYLKGVEYSFTIVRDADGVRRGIYPPGRVGLDLAADLLRSLGDGATVY